SVTIKAIAEKELISEEMRLIYVALTRAKEQLFLIGRVKDEADLDKLIQTVVSDNHLPVSYRLTAQRPIELIYPILAKYQSSELPRELRFENQITDLPVELQPRVTLNVDHYEDIANETEHSTNSARSVTDIVNSEANQEQQQQIYHQLAYEYPYPKDIVKASKQSVSELKRQLETEEAGTNYDRVRQYSIGSAAYERPAFLAQNVKRRANEIGTLMHTVMQHLPFQEGGLTESELDQYLDQLVAKNIIAEADKNDVNIGEIIQFTHSELYNTITHSDYIFRELPFIVNQSKVDQNFDEDEDISIIQGMIDLIFVKDNQYYFVDYKTDAFNRRRGMTDQEIGEQLRQRYKIQMTYYQKTLETILDKQVKGYLYFFKYGQLSIED
ncbi:helicase-exonuclease AddAB subunit AddA, partial [Staphylococcus arlettae]